MKKPTDRLATEVISDDEGFTETTFAVGSVGWHGTHLAPGMDGQTIRVRSEQTERRRRMEAEKDADAIWERMPREAECGTCVKGGVACYREILENNGKSEGRRRVNGVAVKVGSANYGRCQRCLKIRRVCETSNAISRPPRQTASSLTEDNARKRKNDGDEDEGTPWTLAGQKKKARLEGIERPKTKLDGSGMRGLGAKLAKGLGEGQVQVTKELEAFLKEQKNLIEVLIRHKDAL
ncbi:hypothetical protein FA13DRAFT_1741964 [Coprinellus micaceus]|uniref:Uncharacterized protein n=1 Tax=Coprinellus micaceus TaxID=71717 RepID=A0A4Y7SHM7_COPMI|nr:hypothetical protein FA13DRAFT_1741964 [Coprinellus micaceus]